jgi:hypothetical protein
MLKVEIKSTDIDSFSGISKKTGQPFAIRSQTAYAHTFDRNGVQFPYPQQIKISLDDDQLPFAVGAYVVAPQCIYVDKFGKLALGRLSLTPVPNQMRQAA